MCAGTERNITDCPDGTTDQCTHANDAGVTCRTSTLTAFVELPACLISACEHERAWPYC